MFAKLKKAVLYGLVMALPASVAMAQALKIGVLTDMSGPYSDTNGMGSVIATQMAVEQFGGSVNGNKIEVIYADHNNKTDIAASIARRWLDAEGVDMIIDLTNSAVALSVAQIAKERDRVAIPTGPAVLDLTNESCAPTTVHWAVDTYLMTAPIGREMVATGAKNWYMYYIDGAVGRSAKANIQKSLEAAGGRLVGESPHPVGLQDFTSLLLQSQRPNVEGRVFFTAGNDLIAAVRQANQFGLTKQKIASLIGFENELKGIGPAAAEGIIYVNHWYWDRNDNTRAFSKNWADRVKGDRVPGYGQAGAYAATLHYLKAVAAVKNSKKGSAVVDEMKKIPIDDALFGKGEVRADGRASFPAYVWKAKGPSESKGGWDVASMVREVPADQAWQPLSESRCSLVKKH
ncbi:ABC transporter substrate-binding protein [Ferrovibrio sp.]|uniref:ABC transporter substrate-binding protein n=1 Tax=Ferrovibrio sp. TaxID=1917215 RepID=UPI003D0ECD2F